MKVSWLRCTVVVTLAVNIVIDVSSFSSPVVRSHTKGWRDRNTLSMSTAENSWTWKGHNIYTQVSSESSKRDKPAVLLLHGFGCSTVYWRATEQALVDAGYEVHALDLLGQGKSSKPGRADGIEYSINLWAEMVDNYVRENIERDIILMGNSLGSVVSLSAACGDFKSTEQEGTTSSSYISENGLAKGVCLFNCGIGMNSQGVANEPDFNAVQRFLIKALFNILNSLVFGNIALLTYILTEVVTRDLLRSALQNLYLIKPERVDDVLVESFYLPAKDEGSVEALSQIYTNNPGKSPVKIVEDNSDIFSNIPIHCVWGEEDPVTPFTGPVGQFFFNSAKTDKNVSFELISSGHIPFDDSPEQSNGSMMDWLNNVVVKEKPSKQPWVRFWP